MSTGQHEGVEATEKQINSRGVKSLEEAAQHEDLDYQLDGGLRAWSVVFAGFLINFVGLGYTYAFGVYQYLYEYKYPHSSSSTIAFIGSTNLAVTFGTGIFIGRAIELWGYRLTMAVGSIVYCASMLASSICNTVHTLILTQGILNGAAGSAFYLCATAAPLTYFSKRATFAMGVTSTGVAIGGLAWSFIVRAASARWSTNWALRITAFIDCIILFAATMMLQTPPSRRKASKAGSFKQSLKLCWEPRFILLYLASAIAMFGYFVPTFYMPLYIQIKCGASQSDGATISAVSCAGMVVGRLGLAWFGDRGIGKVNVVLITMISGGLLQLLMWNFVGSNLGASFAFAVIYATVAGTYVALIPSTLLVFYDPDKLSSLGGIFFSSELAGQLAGTPIAGALLSSTGGKDFRPLICYAGGIMILGAVFAVAARLAHDRRIWIIV